MTRNYGFTGNRAAVLSRLFANGRCRIVDTPGAAALFGVKPNTVAIWKSGGSRGTLPDPDIPVTRSGLWLVDTLLEWAKEHKPEAYEHAVTYLGEGTP